MYSMVQNDYYIQNMVSPFNKSNESIIHNIFLFFILLKGSSDAKFTYKLFET